MKALDINIDIDLSGFQLTKGTFKTRYVKPRISKLKPESCMKYKKAEELAESVDTSSGFRHYSIVDGSFVFGDFIEALIVKNNWYCEEMFISTLSLNENNIDSLENLFNGGYLGKLTLVVSAYFYSHERQPNRLIDYILRSLDKDDRLDLVVTRSHCKICQFSTDKGHKITMRGSANLRSSQNLEQLDIDDNEDIYNINRDHHYDLRVKYGIINKNIEKKE